MLNQLALGWSIFWRIFYMEIRATTINYHWSWFVFSSWKLLWINLGNISMWNIVVLVGKNAIKSWTSLPHAHFSQAWSPNLQKADPFLHRLDRWHCWWCRVRGKQSARWKMEKNKHGQILRYWMLDPVWHTICWHCCEPRGTTATVECILKERLYL